MPQVLVGPMKPTISSDEYGKSYNLLDNMSDDYFQVKAYARMVETDPEPENVIVHELGGSNRISYYLRLYRTLARELRSSDFDIYHHMNLSFRWFNPLLLAGVQDSTPVVIGPCQAGHAIMAEEFNRMLENWTGRELQNRWTNPLYTVVEGLRNLGIDPARMELFKQTLQAADRIVVVHEEAKQVYSQFVAEEKLRTIPLGVNPDLFEYNQRSDTQELVAIGNLRRRKGYDILFRALKSIQRSYPDVHLHVFGEGPLEDELRQQVLSLGLQSNVTFHGYVDQSIVREHLSRARAFVHPSRSESFSLVRLEAMSTGCPMVVTDISGAREMVRDGEEGFVVPIESPEPIADAVMTLLDDYELTKRLGRQARQRVEEKYDWRTIGQEYLDMYRTLSQ